MSESKFRDDPAAFIAPIRARDRAALEALITKPEVERKLLQRLRKKASLYALNFTPDGEPLSDDAARKIDVDGVVELYEHYIIPLTKEVEVRPVLATYYAWRLREICVGGLPTRAARRALGGGRREVGIEGEELIALSVYTCPRNSTTIAE